jgi:hypothetical protein
VDLHGSLFELLVLLSTMAKTIFSSPGVYAWVAMAVTGDASPFRGFLEESP